MNPNLSPFVLSCLLFLHLFYIGKRGRERIKNTKIYNSFVTLSIIFKFGFSQQKNNTRIKQNLRWVLLYTIELILPLFSTLQKCQWFMSYRMVDSDMKTLMNKYEIQETIFSSSFLNKIYQLGT